ncbi:MAG: hypothetical protein E4H19_04255 [Chromatiales bacterium]|jgi:hypothetical protein|nr:MAG: hypothetical protein E4H19_04255 [Chromatiales bacterium]
MHQAYTAVLLLNVLWFGAGFRYFGLTPDTAARVLVPKSARELPLFKTLSAAMPFLGGMNLAFAVLAVLLLLNQSLFPEARQQAVLAFVFAIAHGSQFAFNVPVALRGGRQGEAYWPVLNGPMLFIFVVDGALSLANLLVAGGLWL